MARTFRVIRNGAVLAAFFILLVLIAARLDEAADSIVHGPFHVIDGDTLAVGGERLRLQGVDAPELDQTCEDGRGRPWACGEEARRLLVRLVADGEAECLGRERDKYRRLLVRCRSGTTSVNGTLVRQGLAVASGRYAQEQVAARRERLGVWAGQFESPRDWRASRGMMDDTSLVEAFMAWAKRVMAWQ
ncbi:thermonuclease family protein [Neorhizobium galegae]|uniref:thermonuclease family protein n=1 Tax=Neorhizobium galegae TaxID=399 RepID=UPI000621C9AF|nr:thermonuclease family protein [Neorhizobium galegae]CDZ29301.1 Succinoglycan biosynthesis protein [Neorhizobium galegae bv. officinalis]KAA9387091.1 thermonuclease family protein [Neorhizobium galegae]KAB1116204.1 thermonuclease family protein [Neorhizobium galegae]MCM2501683.1 thermonuclease family protein [Neorhizobium galegae]MCQ1771429.1 thermonuclease family protein [Neorhizobium galegae]